MLRASLLTGAAFASAQVATLLWTQSLDVAVFTSAGLSRHNDTGPTFSTATWLNQPVEVDAIDSMGMTTWSFIEPGESAERRSVKSSWYLFYHYRHLGLLWRHCAQLQSNRLGVDYHYHHLLWH